MKRPISGFLAIIMLLVSLSACSKPTQPTDNYNIEDYKNSGGLSEGLTMPDEPEMEPVVIEPENNQKPSDVQKPDNNTQQETSVPEDADSDDLPDNRQEGAVDTTTEQTTQDLPYKDKVTSSIADTVITKDSYDESKLSLPCVRIDTFDSSGVVSKTEYKNGTLEINNTVKNFSKNKTAVEIRGRGNSTWVRFDKKAYKLKFQMKTSLLGMGEAKKWVLLANAFDETMVRSALAFDLATKLGLEFTTQYRYVNLYLNGKYQGIYILCEQLEEGEARVNIDSSKSGEVDTGYLLESYSESTEVKDRSFTVPEVNGQHLKMKERGHQFVIKSPGPKTATDDQVAFIKDYVTKVNQAIFTGDWDTITKLCDIDSFVNMFIVDQVMLNNDMGYSFYMYKKAGGKLYLGPAWDYDQSCGNSSHGGSTYKGWYAGSEHGWYSALIKLPQFKALVKARYEQKKADIKALPENADKIIKSNSYDFAMSNYVYNTFGDKNRWRTMKEIYSLTTYKMHVEYLKTWLSNRYVWMEDQFKEW